MSGTCPPWSPYPVRWGAFRRAPEATLDEWFGRLLMYRERAEQDEEEASAWAGRALQEARQWFDGIVGWAMSFVTDTDHDERFGELAIEDQRALLAERLRHLPGLPPAGAMQLCDALIALNSGQVNALVSPSPTRRRGKRPHDRLESEIELLQLRAFRRGLGQPAATVDADLANAIGRSVQVLDQWQHVSLPKELGAGEVEQAVDFAYELGVAVASGQHLDTARRMTADLWQSGWRFRELVRRFLS